MIKYCLKLILSALCITLLSACSEKTRLAALDTNATILAFGDSLTYGTGTSPDKAYPAVLARLARRKVINAGIPGEVSKQGLLRLPGLLQQYQPDLIIICHGANDILRKQDIAITKSNLQKMINLARENHTQVVLIGVPEFSLFLNTSPIYPALAKKNKLVIEQDIIADILAKNALKSDRIHPNSTGYQMLAERIYNLLKNSGALP